MEASARNATHFSRSDASAAAFKLAPICALAFALATACGTSDRAGALLSPVITLWVLVISALGALVGASIGAGALIARARRAWLAAAATTIGIVPFAVLLWMLTHALE